MTRRGFMAALAALVLAPRRARADGAPTFKVIVHPERRLSAVEKDFLRRVYLKKVATWPDGSAVHPVDLPRAVPARDRFTRDVLKKTPSQLRSYWSQQVFSGKGTPPPEVASAEAAVRYVLSDADAVGYVPSDVDAGRARVVELS